MCVGQGQQGISPDASAQRHPRLGGYVRQDPSQDPRLGRKRLLVDVLFTMEDWWWSWDSFNAMRKWMFIYETVEHIDFIGGAWVGEREGEGVFRARVCVCVCVCVRYGVFDPCGHAAAAGVAQGGRLLPGSHR